MALIKKQIDSSNTLIKTSLYPKSFVSKGGNKALLGIGGNIGDVLRRFGHLFWCLKRSGFVRIVETSPILKNPAFGYIEQDDFYNALLLIETQLTPKALLCYILRIERLFGRKRLFKDAPRTLDIDIIFYENVNMDTKSLTLPHPEWMKRSSILIPLTYMKGHI